MDGSSVEHSDSDSGESWTLLENNSIYADEPPEFIEGREKHGAHHDKDEDTDGISIISDSDHEAPTPPPSSAVYEKLEVQSKKNISDKDILDFVSVDPHLIDNNKNEPEKAEVFTEENHVRHKTYVHRRNKQLSTVLNIIVLGSVITAAGVAIGHMWGAKNDCTIQTSSSINKILSNLYKLQEENAYLRGKLKELTFLNNQYNQHQRPPLKNNKCKKVFEESLNNNDPRKFTKCIDINNNNAGNFIEHTTTPKFEKEFIADMDKLKTVYLQNKSWLDDEISRRIKIEEELLKKYNDEVNSAIERKQESADDKNNKPNPLPDSKNHKVDTLETLQNYNSDNFAQNKVSYADSLKNEKSRFRRNEERYDTDEDNDWLISKQQFHFIDHDIKDSTKDEHAMQNRIAHPQSYENRASDYVNYLAKSVQEPTKNPNKQFIHTVNLSQEGPENQRNEELFVTEDNKWFKITQENKNKAKKEKRGKKKNANRQILEGKKDQSNAETPVEYKVSEADFIKDDRYLTKNLYKEKKKNNSNINSNKKQKRKNKFEKWNKKGEFGDKFEAVKTPEDIALNYPEKNNNFDYVSFTNFYESDRSSEKNINTEEKLEKKTLKEQPLNWFEKRAVFRNDARKKHIYEQFGETTFNNSSWYFRRMRKREQCRTKADNSTYKNYRKEKKYDKMKQ